MSARCGFIAQIVICFVVILIFIYWFFFIFSFKGACIQVLQEARNPLTGQVKTFPTPCDVPLGWQKITQDTNHRASSQPDETVYTDKGSANWKTYQGGGYSLKYPPTWSIVSSGDLRNQDKVIKGFSVHRESLVFTGNFEDWCKQEPSCTGYLSGMKKKNINGIDAYQYMNTGEKTAKIPGSWTYIPHDSRIYQVSWGIWPLDMSNYKFNDLIKEFNDPTFNQILSTFKFL